MDNNETIYQVILGVDGLVVTLIQSNLLQEGAEEIDQHTYAALQPVVGRARLVGGGIVPYDPPPPEDGPFLIPVPLLRQRIQALGMWDEFAAYLAQNPAEMLIVLTTESGVDPAYPAFAVAFDSMEVPKAARDIILAPPSAGIGVS